MQIAGAVTLLAYPGVLIASFMALGGGELLYSDLDAAIRRADKQHLSTAVHVRRVTAPGMTPPRVPDGQPEPMVKRTPLGFMLERSVFGPGGDYDPANTRPHFVEFALLMVARGATLTPEEIHDNPEIKRRLQAIMEWTPPR